MDGAKAENKKLVYVLISVVVVILIGFVVALRIAKFFTGNLREKDAIANQVRTYVTINKKLSDKDILSVEGKFNYKKNEYYASVIFKDEPTSIYNYEVSNNQLILISKNASNGKHIER